MKRVKFNFMSTLNQLLCYSCLRFLTFLQQIPVQNNVLLGQIFLCTKMKSSRSLLLLLNGLLKTYKCGEQQVHY